MAIYQDKDGLYYVEGAEGQSFPRLEEARVVNDQVKQGVYQTKQQVGQIAGSPEMAGARQEETGSALTKFATEQGPTLAATGVTMATPGLREAGIIPMLGRAGVFSLVDYARQLMSGEEPSAIEAGKAGATSLGVEGGLALGGKLAKGAIGKSSGVMERLAESKIPIISNIGKKFGVAPDQAAVKQAYNVWENLGQAVPQGVPLDQANQPLRNLLKEMRLRGNVTKELQTDLQVSMQAPIKSFKDVDEILHKLNIAAEKAAPNERRLIYQAKDSIWNDIDNAQVPAAQKAAYKLAVQKARDNFAKQELDDLVKESVVGRVGQTSGVPVPKTKSLLEGMDRLAADPGWVKSMGGPDKVNQIREFVRKIHYATAKASNEGTAVVLGGTGGAAGHAIGGNYGAAIGAAAGVSGPGWVNALAEKPLAAKLFLRMLNPNAVPYTREALTGLFNTLMTVK